MDGFVAVPGLLTPNLPVNPESDVSGGACPWSRRTRGTRGTERPNTGRLDERAPTILRLPGCKGVHSTLTTSYPSGWPLACGSVLGLLEVRPRFTTAKPVLGRLERVELRDAWLGEASDFTPWLAQAENIALLGEAIGIELEVESQEKNVGPF